MFVIWSCIRIKGEISSGSSVVVLLLYVVFVLSLFLISPLLTRCDRGITWLLYLYVVSHSLKCRLIGFNFKLKHTEQNSRYQTDVSMF